MSEQRESILPPFASAPPALQSDPGLAPENPAERSAAPASTHGPERIPHWLARFELFLRVLLRLYLGLVLAVVPWWPAFFWEHNPLFSYFPALGPYAVSGAVRGFVTGLGLLNLWIAFSDAIRYRNE